jgi:hypothetical protein
MLRQPAVRRAHFPTKCRISWMSGVGLGAHVVQSVRLALLPLLPLLLGDLLA